jgi:hypothetical protein
MKSLAIHAALLAGLGALMFTATVASIVPAAAKCMTDDSSPLQEVHERRRKRSLYAL